MFGKLFRVRLFSIFFFSWSLFPRLDWIYVILSGNYSWGYFWSIHSIWGYRCKCLLSGPQNPEFCQNDKILLYKSKTLKIILTVPKVWARLRNVLVKKPRFKSFLINELVSVKNCLTTILCSINNAQCFYKKVFL